jgi:small ligand-binding sensory domain FIST
MYRHGVQIANDVFEAGVSGVAFSANLGIQVKVSQGCAPISNPYRITAYDQNLVQSLDGKPALRVLRQTLIDHAGHQLPIEENWPSTLKHFANRLQIGILSQKTSENYLVRSLMGIDPVHQFLAIGHEPVTGEHLIFCLRDLDTATHDLRRVCAEIREDVEDVSIDVAVLEEGAELPAGKTIYGALYIACMGRGQALFGASNELKIIQHALGNVPLIGCYASGEIADGELYGMTGILIVFSG